MRISASRAACCLVLLVAGDAHGHQFSLLHGMAIVHADRISVRIEVTAEDLLHIDPQSVSAAGDLTRAWHEEAASDYELFLLDSLVVRGEGGERLSGRCVKREVDGYIADPIPRRALRGLRAAFSIEFSTARSSRFVTFQHDTSRAPADMSSQLALYVADETESETRVVRLTSRGNAETLEFPASAGADPERFHRLLGEAAVRGGALEVRVSLPLTLAETWQTIPRAGMDHLTMEEQSRVVELVRGMLARAFEVRADGAAVVVDGPRVSLLGVDGAPAGVAAGSKLSFWTARAEAVWRMGLPAGSRRVELEWKLFNSAVLTAGIRACVGDLCEVREVSAYEPVVGMEVGGSAAR